jgi:hypothetical protein
MNDSRPIASAFCARAITHVSLVYLMTPDGEAKDESEVPQVTGTPATGSDEKVVVVNATAQPPATFIPVEIIARLS